MHAFPPADEVCDLDMHHRRNGVGIVVGSALDIDDPGHHVCIDVEEPGAAVTAEVPAAMFRGSVDLGLALRYLDRVLRIHGPADHRCACMAPAIGAVTQRVSKEFALDLVTDRATVTAACDDRHAFPPTDET